MRPGTLFMFLGPKGIFLVVGQDNYLLFCQAVRQFLKFADSYNFLLLFLKSMF